MVTRSAAHLVDRAALCACSMCHRQVSVTRSLVHSSTHSHMCECRSSCVVRCSESMVSLLPHSTLCPAVSPSTDVTPFPSSIYLSDVLPLGAAQRMIPSNLHVESEQERTTHRHSAPHGSHHSCAHSCLCIRCACRCSHSCAPYASNRSCR